MGVNSFLKNMETSSTLIWNDCLYKDSGRAGKTDWENALFELQSRAQKKAAKDGSPAAPTDLKSLFMIYMQIGVAYFHLDEYGKAVRAFQEAILANAVHPLPHGGLAEIYTRTHNVSQVGQLLTKIAAS